MLYNKIYNPITKRNVSIYTKKGKRYIIQLFKNDRR